MNYYGRILNPPEADDYFRTLLASVRWKNDEVIMFGRRIVTGRKVAWYGDSNYSYTYSRTTREALAWIPELLALRSLVESLTGATFNSCLLNLYHDGTEGMAWHSDDEKAMGRNTTIASLSLGAERRFCLKHKRTGERVSVTLEHGSLLVMRDETQLHWVHQLPKSKRVHDPRINLTFRTIVLS